MQEKLKKIPSISLVYEENKHGDINFTENQLDSQVLGKRHIVIVVLFALTIAINVFGIFQYEWFLTELSANFFVVGIIIGFVGGLKLNEIFDAFIEGMKIVVFGAIIVGFARAILVVLESGLIIDTIIYSMSSVLDYIPNSVTALGMLVVQVIINFFIPSGWVSSYNNASYDSNFRLTRYTKTSSSTCFPIWRCNYKQYHSNFSFLNGCFSCCRYTLYQMGEVCLEIGCNLVDHCCNCFSHCDSYKSPIIKLKTQTLV